MEKNVNHVTCALSLSYPPWGYCARIAMILHCLEQAICICDDTSDRPWTTIVSPDAVRAVTAITQGRWKQINNGQAKFNDLGRG